MRNSHLYQYLKGLRKAQGSKEDVSNVYVNNQKGKGQKILLSAMTLVLSVGILLPFGEQVTHASAVTSTQSTTYVIKKGDTLYSLSKRYHTTVSKLKQMNQLSSDSIQVGKKILVPAGTSPLPQKPATSNPVKKPVQQKEVPKQTTNSIYNPKVPMEREQQEYLYKLTQQRGLDYRKTLALIKTESTFNPNARGGTNYGLMQINNVNHASLAKKLKTANKPYDPYINMNWGTYMLSDLYKYWKGRGLTGAKLDQYVWSSYNRGLNGAKKYGIKASYVDKMNASVKYINQLFPTN